MGRALKSTAHFCVLNVFGHVGDIFVCDCGKMYYCDRTAYSSITSKYGTWSEINAQRLAELTGEATSPGQPATRIRRTPRQWWRRLFQLDKYPQRTQR